MSNCTCYYYQECSCLGPVAIDCEMVGDYNNQSVLARVSIVNDYCDVLVDKLIHPLVPIKDYRTFIHGLTAEDLQCRGRSFRRTRDEVIDLLDRSSHIIGHSLHHDFAALEIDMASYNHKIIDVARHPTFTNFCRKGNRPSLEYLARRFLGESIQEGVHCSVQDAETCMKLYIQYIE